MKLSIILLSVVSLFVAVPALAEVAEINNPSWQEVPGTKLDSSVDDQYNEPAAVDVNGIIVRGSLLTFDLVNPDASYSRVQTNCKTRKFRAIRKGDFESSTTINYISQIDPWQTPTSSYHRALLQFVCNL